MSPPTKLSQYIKDRSLSRCKDLVRMLSTDRLANLNESKSPAKLILQSHHKITTLFDTLIQELQIKKT